MRFPHPAEKQRSGRNCDRQARAERERSFLLATPATTAPMPPAASRNSMPRTAASRDVRGNNSARFLVHPSRRSGQVRYMRVRTASPPKRKRKRRPLRFTAWASATSSSKRVADRRVSADGVIGRARDQQVLSVGGRHRRCGIADFLRPVGRRQFGEDDRHDRVFDQVRELPARASRRAGRAWCSRASRRLRSSDPGRCTVSASVNSSHSPRAASAPDCAALHLPEQPSGERAGVNDFPGRTPGPRRIRQSRECDRWSGHRPR